MYAVVLTGGKQYRVSVGDEINVEKLNAEAGQTVVLDKVLVIGGEGSVTVGKPYIEGAGVTAEVVENGKGKKVVIFKYKAKKDQRSKKGHRQPYTKLVIKSIAADGIKVEAPAAPVAEAKVNLKSMKKAELVAYAEANNIELPAKATNAEMIAVIEAATK